MSSLDIVPAENEAEPLDQFLEFNFDGVEDIFDSVHDRMDSVKDGVVDGIADLNNEMPRVLCEINEIVDDFFKGSLDKCDEIFNGNLGTGSQPINQGGRLRGRWR